VGAGGHGLATAYHLARVMASAESRFLEKRLLGYGNVGRNTTIFVRSNYLLPQNHYFYEDSLRRWETLSRDLNYNVMYIRAASSTLRNLMPTWPRSLVVAMRCAVAGIDAELLDQRGLAHFGARA